MIFAIVPFLLFIIIVIIMSQTITPNSDSKTHTSPKDVFLHLLMIGTLYVSVFMFCSLWYDYINLLFPDKLNFYFRNILEGVLIATSALMVSFPVYLGTSYLLEKDIEVAPEKREIGIRKWLVYLTLFVAAIAIIIELGRLVYNFQTGELTMNFFLKIIVTLAVASSVFKYHLWDVKRPTGSVSEWPKRFAILSFVLVFGSIGYSYALVGTPSHQRAVRFDDRRVSDLQNLQYQIVNYWQQKDNVLPDDLSKLNDSLSGATIPVDPDTNMPYEYKVKDSLTFELCATFGAASIKDDTSPRMPETKFSSGVGMMGQPVEEKWDHQAGYKCFERKIDPAFYKTNKPTPVIIQNEQLNPVPGDAVQ